MVGVLVSFVIPSSLPKTARRSSPLAGFLLICSWSLLETTITKLAGLGLKAHVDMGMSQAKGLALGDYRSKLTYLKGQQWDVFYCAGGVT